MPRYSKHADFFKVRIYDNNGQIRTTIPKPLYEMLEEKKEVRGTFTLTKEGIVYKLE